MCVVTFVKLVICLQKTQEKKTSGGRICASILQMIEEHGDACKFITKSPLDGSYSTGIITGNRQQLMEQTQAA